MLRNCFKVIFLNSFCSFPTVFSLPFLFAVVSMYYKRDFWFCLFCFSNQSFTDSCCFFTFKISEIKILFENAAQIDRFSFLWSLLRDHLAEPFHWRILNVRIFNHFFWAGKIFQLERIYVWLTALKTSRIPAGKDSGGSQHSQHFVCKLFFKPSLLPVIQGPLLPSSENNLEFSAI